jgi:tRNA-dihydrouridine synthase
MLRHVRDMVSVLGEDLGVREMRKHLCWYTKGLPEGAEFRDRVNHLARFGNVQKEIGSYFAGLKYDAETAHPTSVPV